jgi:hypothetical protein
VVCACACAGGAAGRREAERELELTGSRLAAAESSLHEARSLLQREESVMHELLRSQRGLATDGDFTLALGGSGEPAAVIGWVEVLDEEGDPYYYHTQSQETTWQRPAEIIKRLSPQKRQPTAAAAAAAEEEEEEEAEADSSPATRALLLRLQQESAKREAAEASLAEARQSAQDAMVQDAMVQEVAVAESARRAAMESARLPEQQTDDLVVTEQRQRQRQHRRRLQELSALAERETARRVEAEAALESALSARAHPVRLTIDDSQSQQPQPQQGGGMVEEPVGMREGPAEEEGEPPAAAARGRSSEQAAAADVVEDRPSSSRAVEEAEAEAQSECRYIEGLGWGRPISSAGQHSAATTAAAAAAVAAAEERRHRWQERRGSYVVALDEQAVAASAGVIIGGLGRVAEDEPPQPLLPASTQAAPSGPWDGVELELARETARAMRQEAEERARTAAAERAAAEQ